ncbi:hypothetical protein ACHWQZ_G002035 [Mnemiopsis leidyi]
MEQVSAVNDSISEMAGLTSHNVWGQFSSQPTLTELVRLGIANEEPDYITDPVYSRYQEMSPWHDAISIGHARAEQAHTQAHFLEQNDMTMIPPSEHSIPQESLPYLVEDDNSYLRLEQDLSSDCQVDVIGDDTYNITHDTVKIPIFSKATTAPQHSNPQHSNPQHSNPQQQQHLQLSKPVSLNGLHPHRSCSKPNSRTNLVPHISCSKSVAHSPMQSHQQMSSKQNTLTNLPSCTKTNPSGLLSVSDQLAFPQLQSHVTSRDTLMTSRDALITPSTPITPIPHLQSISDRSFSLQKLLGFGNTEQQQQNLRVLAGHRPVIGRCISQINPQSYDPFQRFRQDMRPALKSPLQAKVETKRKYVKRMSKDEQIQKGNNLWQFLMRLLGPGSRADIVAWTGNDLEFRIVNKDEIARRWGIIKNREKMNFDKFSRALRYYYNKRILIHNPQCRLTYCFMRRPSDPVFCEMLQSAMRTLPNLHVCGALCNNTSHSHEMVILRDRLEREIIPNNAVNSKNFQNDGNFGATKVIDLNLSTQCKTEQGQDGKAWLEIRFGEVQCVERVIWLGETAEHRFVWTCSETGCDTCGGIEVDRCGEFRVTVSMETRSTNAPSLVSTRCKSGDTVRLERVDYTRYRGIWPAEIAVLETQVLDVEPAEQPESQTFETTKRYGDTSTFVFQGTFQKTLGTTVLYIGLQLDGSFNNYNRGYKISITKHQIDAWPYNPNAGSGLYTNFRETAGGNNYNFIEEQDFKLTMNIDDDGELTFALASGEKTYTHELDILIGSRSSEVVVVALLGTLCLVKVDENGELIERADCIFSDTCDSTLAINPHNTFDFAESIASHLKGNRIKLEIRGNDQLVFNKITATTEGSEDETSPSCSAGSKKDVDNTCVPCPAATYGDDGLTCQNCPTGSTSAAGSDDLSDCVCLENYYGSADTGCLACPSGSSSLAGSNYMSDCVCLENYYGSADTGCLACPSGSSSLAGSDDLSDCVCLENYYGSGATGCLACPSDGTAALGATDISDCQCPKHHFKNANECQECPDDKISPAGSTSESDCIDFMRTRQQREITPSDVHHSKSKEGKDSEYGAKFATDLNFRTTSISASESGDIWLEVILNEVHCIDQVLTFSNDGQPRVTWDCSDTNCDGCSSPVFGRCGEVLLELFENVPSGPVRMPISNNCRYGDRVKIKRKQTNSSQMWITEIAIIEGEGDPGTCYTPDTAWENFIPEPALPVPDGTPITITCPFNQQQTWPQCQNGVFVTSSAIPSCINPATGSGEMTW